jgi:hypothetical protein
VIGQHRGAVQQRQLHEVIAHGAQIALHSVGARGVRCALRIAVEPRNGRCQGALHECAQRRVVGARTVRGGGKVSCCGWWP